MPQRFDNFFHEVTGNEAERCHYPTRLDTYGCGCQHNCGYCYARALLDFRGLWNPVQPSAADPREIRKVIARKLRPGQVVRLGGMTDCFQPMERSRKATLRAIQWLNQRRVHYLIVTKNDLVAEYADIMDKGLAHIQVSITSTDAELSRRIEPGAPDPEARIAAALGEEHPPLGIALLMEGEHLCKTMRGARKPGKMSTCQVTGVFKSDISARNEFLQVARQLIRETI